MLVQHGAQPLQLFSVQIMRDRPSGVRDDIGAGIRHMLAKLPRLPPVTPGAPDMARDASLRTREDGTAVIAARRGQPRVRDIARHVEDGADAERPRAIASEMTLPMYSAATIR